MADFDSAGSVDRFDFCGVLRIVSIMRSSADRFRFSEFCGSLPSRVYPVARNIGSCGPASEMGPKFSRARGDTSRVKNAIETTLGRAQPSPARRLSTARPDLLQYWPEDLMRQITRLLALALVLGVVLASPAGAQELQGRGSGAGLHAARNRRQDLHPQQGLARALGRARVVPAGVHRWLNGRMQLAP